MASGYAVGDQVEVAFCKRGVGYDWRPGVVVGVMPIQPAPDLRPESFHRLRIDVGGHIFGRVAPVSVRYPLKGQS